MLPALLVAAAVRPVMRREIRSLSETEREKFFAAMHVMKRHTLTEGTALYGSHFRTHEYLLRKHASATVDKDCDQGHGGPGFLGFHFAITVAHPLRSPAAHPALFTAALLPPHALSMPTPLRPPAAHPELFTAALLPPHTLPMPTPLRSPAAHPALFAAALLPPHALSMPTARIRAVATGH